MISLATPFASEISTAVKDATTKLMGVADKAQNEITYYEGFDEMNEGLGGGSGGETGGEPVEPPVLLEGDGQEVNKLEESAFAFRSSADYNTFKEVRVDGEVVDQSNYTVSEGSTIITFKWEFAITLTVGNHTISIVSTSGSANGSFDVVETEKLVAGLYDADDNPVADWNTLVSTYGLDVTANYTSSTYNTDTTSLYYILNNYDELSTGTKLIIGDEPTSIGDYAFIKCETLTDITIPDSVTSIGGYAFLRCCSLTSITIPNKVTSIGKGAFEFCTGLTSIIIPDSVTRINFGAFEYCSGLTNVTIGSGVTYIGKEAFNGCSALTSAVFKDTTTWYYTSSTSSTNGIQYSVTDPSNAASNLKTSITGHWYKE